MSVTQLEITASGARPIFDCHAEMQRAAGLINPRVYHSADSNKSEIVVVFDTEDTKKAK